MFETIAEIYYVSSELIAILKYKIAEKVYTYIKENKKC